MSEYIINKIIANGYERVIELKDKNSRMITVGLLEPDEYVEDNDASKKRMIGDTITGNLSIIYVCDKLDSDTKLQHQQTIPDSPHIEATVIITKQIDEYSFYALSSVTDYEILVKFEQCVTCIIGEKIFIEGELSINI